MASRNVIAIAALVSLACSGNGQQSAGTGGSGVIGGSAGAAGNAGTGGSAGGDLGPPCVGATPAPRAGTGRLDVPVEVTINGAKAVVGQPGAGRDGREFQLSLFKFFLAEPVLIAADGTEKPAQFLGPDGLPEPYELHLVDADDAATQLLRLSAEVGAYTALRFGVGVPTGCNFMATDQVYPLNPDSDMFWTWGSQFMFIRIEGTSRPNATSAFEPFVYHVGFQPAFTTLTVPGSLTVGADAAATATPTLTLDVDLMLKADADGLPSAQHSVPDGWVVDNLETNQPFAFR